MKQNNSNHRVVEFTNQGRITLYATPDVKIDGFEYRGANAWSAQATSASELVNLVKSAIEAGCSLSIQEKFIDQSMQMFGDVPLTIRNHPGDDTEFTHYNSISEYKAQQ